MNETEVFDLEAEDVSQYAWEHAVSDSYWGSLYDSCGCSASCSACTSCSISGTD